MIGILAVQDTLAQDMGYARSVVKTLASKRFNGRGYVKRGDFKAANYIRKQFRKQGLLPLDSGNYFQPYTFPVNYFPCRMELKLNGKKLKPGVDYLIGATSPSLRGKYKVVIAQRKELLDSLSFFSLLKRADGAFIYIKEEKDSLETKEASAVIDQNLRYLRADTTLKLKGLLLYSPAKLTWTVLSWQEARPWIQLHRPLTDTADPVVELKEDAQFDSAYATQNVAAKIMGSAVPDSFLVVTAHYDHLGRMGHKALFPGANDNASGTAMLLSLSRYYSAHPPRYSIVFIAFSGEEIGLKGSQYFSEHPLIDLKKIKFLLNFDMAGTGVDGIQVVNATVFPRQYDTLVAINDRLHLLKAVKPRGETRNSDHYWFYRYGVPSFFLYTLGGVNYHDIKDTYKSLPFTAFANYEKLMVQFMDEEMHPRP